MHLHVYIYINVYAYLTVWKESAVFTPLIFRRVKPEHQHVDSASMQIFHWNGVAAWHGVASRALPELQLSGWSGQLLQPGVSATQLQQDGAT